MAGVGEGGGEGGGDGREGFEGKGCGPVVWRVNPDYIPVGKEGSGCEEKGVDMRLIGSVDLHIGGWIMEGSVGTFRSRWSTGRGQDGPRRAWWFYFGPVNIEMEWWRDDTAGDV